MDDEVDRLNRAILDALEVMIRADPGGIDAAFRLSSVARQLERIADHATNIAEDVIYLKEGAIIRHRLGLEGGPGGAGMPSAGGGDLDESSK